MPISNMATLKKDFQAGLITDSSPEVGLSDARNILYLNEGITRAPSLKDARLQIETIKTKLNYGDAFIKNRGLNIWWRILGLEVIQNNNAAPTRIEYPAGIENGAGIINGVSQPAFKNAEAPRIQFWNNWVIFSAKGQKVFALTYKARGSSATFSGRFETLDPNDDAANGKSTLSDELPNNFVYQPAQALGSIRDILIGQNYAYVCGSSASNVWRWSATGDISNWTTIDSNNVPLVTASSSGYFPIRNATNLNAQIIYRSNLYVFGDNEIYRISRTNAVDPTTKVPIQFEASLVVEGVGCKGRNALISTRHGIFFTDRAGIFIFDGNQVQNISRGKIQKRYQEIFKDFSKVYSVHWAYLNTIVFFYDCIGLAFNYDTNAWSELTFGVKSQFENYVAISREETDPKSYIKELVYDENKITILGEPIQFERFKFGDSAFGIAPFGAGISAQMNESNTETILEDEGLTVHDALFETHNKTFDSEVSKNLRYIRSVGGIAIYDAITENTDDWDSGEDYLLTGKVLRVRGVLRTFSLTDVILIGLVSREGRFSGTQENFRL